MINGLQQNTIDRLAIAHGRVAIQPPYSDGLVSVTIDNGREFLVSLDGHVVRERLNFSINWNA